MNPGFDPLIRRENVEDYAGIRSVNLAAFDGAYEADLVEGLRAEGVVLVSLVAEIGGRMAGHILFSRMWIETSEGAVAAVSLAPMAVLPEYQRRGVGGRMIRDGLNAVRSLGEKMVIVVGHPDYYPRFGFSSSRTRSLESPFPRDAFMALELRPGALDGVAGAVRYAKSFGL